MDPKTSADGGLNDNNGRDAATAKPSVARRALAGVPTLAILAVLGAAGFWGHHSGWTLPKFEELAHAAPVEEEDWCDEHSVPQSICVECNLDKYPWEKDFGWCEIHGVANCPECHPEVAQVNGEPQNPKYDTVAALAVMDRQENGHTCTLHVRRLQVASDETERKLGIEFELVSEREMTDEFTAPAEVVYDPTSVARMSSLVPGRIWQVRKSLGDTVSQGDILALVDSPSIAEAKSAFVEALIAHRMKKKRLATLEDLAATTSVPSLTMLEAQSACDETKVQLNKHVQTLTNYGLDVPPAIFDTETDQLNDAMRFLGLSAELAEEISKTTTNSSLYPLRAPQSGVVIRIDLVAGEVIDTSKVLYVVADPARMLLTMGVTEENAKYLKQGLPIVFTPDAGGKDLAGKIGWISSVVNDTTRLLEVRVALENVTRDTRANTFGTAHVILRVEPNAIVVPRDAVQWDGCCNVVFVRDKSYRKPGSPKVIHVRKVRPGAHDDKFTELIAGVLPGEVVVSKGVKVLRAEMLSNNLGAG